MDKQALLDYMARDHSKSLEPARPGKHKVDLHFSFKTTQRGNGQIATIDTSYSDLNWKSRCDDDGLTVTQEGTMRKFSWSDLPKKLVLDMEQLQSALYTHRNDLIPFPIARFGPWSEFVCPGWFGTGLYNALLKAGCEQAM
jgi:hypothetical protein